MSDEWTALETGVLPLVIMLVLFGSAILINYLRVHFSLRSLLVAMTVIAITLGFVSFVLNR